MTWNRRQDSLIIIGGEQDLFRDEEVRNGAEVASRKFANAASAAAAYAFAAQHRYASQYLEAAPILAFATMGPKHRATRQSAKYLALRLPDLCERGAPLKEVMRSFGFSPPLRRILPYAVQPKYGGVLKLVSDRIPAAVIGRIIPATPGKQRAWISLLDCWEKQERRRGVDRAGIDVAPLPHPRFEWAAVALANAITAERRISDGPCWNEVQTVCDFAIASDRFSQVWGWKRAAEEAENWHRELRTNAACEKINVEAGDMIDAGKHPDRACVGGFEFFALRTAGALITEGAAMRHCVASYIGDVARGLCHILSVGKDGKRAATVEFSPDWRVLQAKGFANAAPSHELKAAAQNYARLCAVAYSRGPGAWSVPMLQALSAKAVGKDPDRPVERGATILVDVHGRFQIIDEGAHVKLPNS